MRRQARDGSRRWLHGIRQDPGGRVWPADRQHTVLRMLLSVIG
jgi:hypothetical protein